MRTTRTRWGWLVAAAVIVGACDGHARSAPPTGRVTVESVLASCAGYADLPDVYGFCLGQGGAALPSPESVEELCPRAGTWEDDCRWAWVRANVNGHKITRDDLMRACGDNADCAFQLVDEDAPDDVVVAIARCEAHAGPHVDDCVGHALDRWASGGKVDEAEVGRVVAAAPARAARIGRYAGILDACRGTPRCHPDRASPADDACRAVRAQYVDGKLICPTW